MDVIHCGGETKEEEPEAAAHPVSTIRKKRAMKVVLSFLLFMQFKNQAQETAPLSYTMTLPTSLNQDSPSQACLEAE